VREESDDEDFVEFLVLLCLFMVTVYAVLRFSGVYRWGAERCSCGQHLRAHNPNLQVQPVTGTSAASVTTTRVMPSAQLLELLQALVRYLPYGVVFAIFLLVFVSRADRGGASRTAGPQRST